MFRGSIVALVTPMSESGEVDYAAFESLLDWHLDQGSDGVVVLGTTGESPTVTGAEEVVGIDFSPSTIAFPDKWEYGRMTSNFPDLPHTSRPRAYARTPV